MGGGEDQVISKIAEGAGSQGETARFHFTNLEFIAAYVHWKKSIYHVGRALLGDQTYVCHHVTSSNLKTQSTPVVVTDPLPPKYLEHSMSIAEHMWYVHGCVKRFWSFSDVLKLVKGDGQ